MKEIKKFELAGMSCGGYVNHVKKALMHVKSVTKAEGHSQP